LQFEFFDLYERLIDPFDEIADLFFIHGWPLSSSAFGAPAASTQQHVQENRHGRRGQLHIRGGVALCTVSGFKKKRPRRMPGPKLDHSH
jgi:hypothetical protein